MIGPADLLFEPSLSTRILVCCRCVARRCKTRHQQQAAALFADAADIQDRLPYMEPPFWYYPVHQSLGAALLAQGKSVEAEAAFRAALQRSPNNGWAAAGLLRAAEARGDRQAIEEAQALMHKNWFGTGMPAPEQL